MNSREAACQGYLANNRITPALLATFPKLLEKANPDPEQDGQIVEAVPVPGRADSYRVRTWKEAHEHGADYYPLNVHTLTELRTLYVALPT